MSAASRARSQRLRRTGWRRPQAGEAECVGDPAAVGVQLVQALGEWVWLCGAPDFEFESFFLELAVAVGFADVQVGAAHAQPVLPVDPSSAVDDAVQEGHQDQLRGDFAVGLVAGEDVAVAFPEVGGCFEELAHVELPVGAQERGGPVSDDPFDPGAGNPDDHFLVDGVGDPDRVAFGDQAEVLDVGGVIVVGVVDAGQGARDDRFADSSESTLMLDGLEVPSRGLLPARPTPAVPVEEALSVWLLRCTGCSRCR
jgi:hypothetical protein